MSSRVLLAQVRAVGFHPCLALPIEGSDLTEADEKKSPPPMMGEGWVTVKCRESAAPGGVATIDSVHFADLCRFGLFKLADLVSSFNV